MEYDVIVVGGGPAGMASAIESANVGAKTLLIERNSMLGGILNQCIHNGFGLAYFKEELTGPEYATRFRDLVGNNKNITVKLNTFVTAFNNMSVTIQSPNGIEEVTAKAIVLSLGCRERTPANILLTGTRPAGVYTAGQAQQMTNMLGKLPGKSVVILGSGDIGLIMARRLTLEGAKVECVCEINQVPSGLRRNIVQCLDDFNIPLLLGTTVAEVVGKDRVEGVYIHKVDEKYNIIENSRKFIKCDTLVLSVGLTPEIDLTPFIEINPKTKGPVVDDYLMTSKLGYFACGNFLHVHDLVDNVALESLEAGKNAGLYSLGKLPIKSQKFNITNGNLINYVVPSYATKGEGVFKIKFRFKQKFQKQFVVAKCGNEVIAKRYFLAGVPGEMESIEVGRSKINSDIIVEVE